MAEFIEALQMTAIERTPALIVAAESGDANAQHALGERYRVGLGVPQDYVAALSMHERAALQGHGGSHEKIGGMLLLGHGRVADPALAAQWFRTAADLGEPNAAYALGKLLLSGNGVVANSTEAAHWIGLAAIAGISEAISTLGTMALQGIGVEQSIVRAARLHIQAALLGEASARASLHEYLSELQAIAEAGDLSAALSMVRVHLHGLLHISDVEEALTQTDRSIDIEEALAWVRKCDAFAQASNTGDHSEEIEQLKIECLESQLCIRESLHLDD